jgi:hypothetical protein
MLRLRRIVHDHQEAGSVSSLISIWGFVDDETFITKAGHLGVAYRRRLSVCASRVRRTYSASMLPRAQGGRARLRAGCG